MRKATVRSVVISFLWILMSAGAGVVAAEVTSTKRVLLLHQSAVGEPVRARFDAAFVEAVRSSEFIPFDLDEETLDDYWWSTQRRAKALNWLCGYGTTWDDAPVFIE